MRVMARTNFEQLKDEFTLLVLLRKLEEAGFETQRLKLQKLLYFTDVFGTILFDKPTNYTFLVYKYGPYTKEIQCDVEHLVSNGLVEAEEVKSWDPDQERTFKYKIKKHDQSAFSNMYCLLDYANVEKVIDFVIQSVGSLASEEIKSLVYAEPNFMIAKGLVAKGEIPFASPIDKNYVFVQDFVKTALEIYRDKFGVTSTPTKFELSWFYLNFIESLEQKSIPEHSVVDK